MKNSKRTVALLIIFFAAGIALVFACAFEDWDDTEGSVFTPEIINKPKYEPFFRTSSSPFYGSAEYNTDWNKTCNELNIKEWNGFFDGKIGNDKLDYWLCKAAGKEVGAMLLITKGKKGIINDTSKKFSLAEIQPADKVNAFLFYLGFAKRNESFVCQDKYGELPEKKEGDSLQIIKQIEGGLKLFGSAKTDFIKERYVFQLIRLYYFGKQFSEAIALYEKNEQLFKSGNSMKWRAMGYAAASNYKLKKYSTANYYYSLIYDGFEPHSKSAYRSFHPQEEKDWEECLKLAKSTKEKIVLWQLFGLYFDDVRAIKEIYKLDPGSDFLELLLVRAINVAEENSGRPEIIKYGENTNENFSSGHDEKLIAFVCETAKENKTSNDPLWDLAAAHLNYCNRNFTEGDKFLKEAEKAGAKNDLFAAQYHVVNLFGMLNRESKMTESIEKKILPEIQRLFEEGKTIRDKSSGSNFRSAFAIRWVRNTLSVLYARDGQFEKAEMIWPGTIEKRFEKKENVIKMIAYFEGNKQTDLENFFISQSIIYYDDYLELLGITYATEDKLDSALLNFKKMKSGTKTLYGNPFTIHIKDCHDCDHGAAQKVKYNSYSFIEKMIEMKNKAVATKKEAAQNYFLVANGFYNISYFGNARYFYSNNVGGYDNSYEYAWAQPDKGANTETALKYYLLAAENSLDNEFKAKCMFMAAKCELMPEITDGPYGGIAKGDAEYYGILIKNYSKTKYYQEILNECSYFKHYVGK